jgi:hypothetical protein
LRTAAERRHREFTGACRFSPCPFDVIDERAETAAIRHASSLTFKEKPVMKYFSLFLPDPNTNHAQQTPAQREAMNAFVGDAIARGEFVSGGGFLPLSTTGAVVRRINGDTRVIDGPYVESKEWVGGYAMLEYASREAAIDGARRFLAVAGDGECVTYQIMEGPHPDA